MSRPFRLSRRAFLGGAGVLIGLPALEAMEPLERVAYGQAMPSPTSRPQRLVLFTTPNGCSESTVPGSFMPSTTGTGFALPTVLQSLAPVRSKLSVFSGLSNLAAAPHDEEFGDWQSPHNDCAYALYTGRFTHSDVSTCASTPPADLTSVDQLAAYGTGSFRGVGTQHTPWLPSLQLCTLDWAWCETNLVFRNGTTQSPTTHPSAVFDALFAGFDPGASSAAVLRRQHERTSVLDYVNRDAQRLSARLGSADRARLDQYLTAIGDLESRVQAVGSTMACTTGARPSDPPQDNSTVQERVRLMLDLIVHAFRCDRTRVVSFSIEASGWDPFEIPGTTAGWHDALIHRSAGYSTEERARQLVVGFSWLVAQFAYLAQQLDMYPDAADTTSTTRTLLDNSAVLMTSPFGTGDGHWLANCPALLAGGLGGAISPGRHATFGDPTNYLYNTGRPLADLYLALLQSMGIGVSSFGNSTGPINLMG